MDINAKLNIVDLIRKHLMDYLGDVCNKNGLAFLGVGIDSLRTERDNEYDLLITLAFGTKDLVDLPFTKGRSVLDLDGGYKKSINIGGALVKDLDAKYNNISLNAIKNKEISVERNGTVYTTSTYNANTIVVNKSYRLKVTFNSDNITEFDVCNLCNRICKR